MQRFRAPSGGVQEQGQAGMKLSGRGRTDWSYYRSMIRKICVSSNEDANMHLESHLFEFSLEAHLLNPEPQSPSPTRQLLGQCRGRLNPANEIATNTTASAVTQNLHTNDRKLPI